MASRIVHHTTIAILAFTLAACGATERSATPPPAAATAVPTIVVATTAPTEVPAIAPTDVPPTPEPPAPAATDAPTAVAAPAEAQLSFTPATYMDERAGFALDYPADWTVDPTSQIGVRGGQALLFSPGTTLETLADGGTRVSITTYLWDPQHDIDAYVTQRKIAWDASGFPIVSEDGWQLADGREARIFIVETPTQPTFILFTTIGDDYLQIGGEGDLALAEEIAHTLRPLE